MPCSPPMMFVSIVGQAIFQTAERSGPSTMERSYREVAAGCPAEGSEDDSSSARAVASVTDIDSLVSTRQV